MKARDYSNQRRGNASGKGPLILLCGEVGGFLLGCVTENAFVFLLVIVAVAVGAVWSAYGTYKTRGRNGALLMATIGHALAVIGMGYVILAAWASSKMVPLGH